MYVNVSCILGVLSVEVYSVAKGGHKPLNGFPIVLYLLHINCIIVTWIAAVGRLEVSSLFGTPYLNL